jgi:NAD(P)-dependent dehydrogenase (short-subunit alcohol dehydrogenase family)
MSNVWLITGSSRGLGLEIAKAALLGGHRVVATARNIDALSALDALGASNRLRKVALDVNDEHAAKAAVDVAVDAFGSLDVVVNNAGYANVCSVEDVAMTDFRAQFETNFFGLVNVTRAALPVMRRQKRGHFVQVGSMAGRMGSAGLAAYSAAKFAVEGFSESLALETKPFGVHVTVVEPGSFRTDWAGSSMRVDPFGDDYATSVGHAASAARSMVDNARGEPAKAARAILELTTLTHPPLYLPLGTDAVFLAKLVSERRRADDANWEQLGRTTDADGVEDFANSRLAELIRGIKV